MSNSRVPALKGRDSTGHEVALLNHPSSVPQSQQRPIQSSQRPIQSSMDQIGRNPRTHPQAQHMERGISNRSIESIMSVPSLLTRDSTDSPHANQTRSPDSPILDHGGNYALSNQYEKDHGYLGMNHREEPRSGFSGSPWNIGSMYSYGRNPREEMQPLHRRSSNTKERKILSRRRYPCPYRERENCHALLTTSGHATRHGKIHESPKVRCTVFGCMRRFTRRDNMKQHLAIHFKNKPRSSSGIVGSNGRSSLTMSAEVQRGASPRPRTLSHLPSSNTPPFDLQDQGHPTQHQGYPTQSNLLMGAPPQPSHPEDQAGIQNPPPQNPLSVLADAASYVSKDKDM
ncbi:hypothetical protein NHQ30_006853 [Ciborinia camelliae]|nr:hypothetical protein NHQ30_006853 [Ciborinia camelliae]